MTEKHFKKNLIMGSIIPLILFISYACSPDDFDRIVEETNKRLEYSVIEPLNKNWIVDTKSQENEIHLAPIKSLKITTRQKYIREDIHFKSEQYTVLPEDNIEELENTVNSLYRAVDDVYDRKNKLVDALSEGNLSLPTKFVEIDIPLKVFTEFYYILRKLAETNYSHIEIFVRGYADGEKSSGWTEKFREGFDDEEYRIFYVHKQIDSNSKEQKFSKARTQVEVPNPYTNRHLPNLRANFIKLFVLKRYVESYLLQIGIPKKNISYGILEGFEYKEPNEPLNRKVDIFINIY